MTAAVASASALQVLAGGLAGVLAWLPIYPLDVIKTRVQAAVSAAASAKTWWQHTKEVRRTGGRGER